MLIRGLSDVYNQRSFAATFRRKGFEVFRRLLDSLPRPVTILDVGGTPYFWDMMGVTEQEGLRVTLVNLEAQPTRHAWMSSLVANATNLSTVDDGQFDVAFSYSLIEHVGPAARQQQVAHEIRRVGRRYFVQTPNFWFPIEPHFLFPAFHWLPLGVRAWLVGHFRLGWIERIPDRAVAGRTVAAIRLLRRGELCTLFPGATLYESRLFGLTQSFIVYGGW